MGLWTMQPDNTLMANPEPRQPDLAMAERYLTLLDETAERFVFQTFDDNKQRKDKGLAAVRIGTLRQHQQTLTRANAAGAGVFVTVNESDGKGRKLENITRIRTVWHEEDTPHTKPFPLEPNFTIESSPEKFHHYWLVDGLSKDDFTGVMECLIQVYGSDPNVKDTARVLRLPGFFHLKNPAQPFMVRMVHESGGMAYTRAQILAAFPPMEKVNKPTAALPLIAPDGEATDGHKALAASLAAKAAAATHASPTMGRHSQVLWLGRECAHRGVPQAAGPYALQCFAKLMRPTDTTGQVAGLNFEAELKAFNDAYGKGLANPPSPYHPPRDTRPAPQPENVTPISVAVDRRELEKRIDALGDDPDAGEALAAEVRQSTLSEAGKNRMYSKIAKATGLRLKDLQGSKPPPKRPRDDGPGFLGEDPADFMPELNARHAVVPFGGKVYILSIEHDPILQRRIIRYYLQSDLDLLYANRLTWGNGEMVPISKAWVSHAERKTYHGVIFAPCEGFNAHYFNLWQGWGVTPATDFKDSLDRVLLFLDFVDIQICARNREKYTYLLNWIAHLFQKPLELPEVAIVLRSGMGTGKNTLVDALAAIVGQDHYIPLSSVAQVTGQFSGHLADSLLVFANEAIWGGDKSAQGTLNAMITDSPLPVERKGKDIITMANYKRMIFASNENWVVPRGMDDRRFAIFDVSEEHKQDHAYFKALREEMDDAGFLPALMRVLLDQDITGWHPRNIPQGIKDEGFDMKILSANSVIQWWYTCLDYGLVQRGARDKGDVEYIDHAWPTELNRIDTHSAYLRWCAMQGISRPALDTIFGKELRKYGIQNAPRSREDNRTYKYFFPPLEEARQLFADAVGVSVTKLWTVAHDGP